MFKKVLIANRGEIACRVMRTCRRMGIRTVAVYSDADAQALHVAEADEAVRIGGAPPKESYLAIDRILAAAATSGAEAIHPGYGFLSENADFAQACEDAGLVFVGPPAPIIRAMGLKDEAKRIARAAGVPVVPGADGVKDEAELLAAAERIGWPVLIKAVAGGGGRGMRRVDSADRFFASLEAARREALGAFGDDRVLLERCIVTPRHIEVQVFGDNHGQVVHLFERDCSIQRRHQKVIEESPAPGLPDEMRTGLADAAVKIARHTGYRGAGTVEFIADVAEGPRADRFWFMEMNTRLQVEHPVTEMVTGLDLVEWQLRVAGGEPLPLAQSEIHHSGHAIEVRICAENPRKRFLPSPGALTVVDLASALVRVDTGVRAGDVVTPWYDSLLAKVIAHGPTRAAAIERLRAALELCRVEGVATNLDLLHAICGHPAFRETAVDTGFLEREAAALLDQARPTPDPPGDGV